MPPLSQLANRPPAQEGGLKALLEQARPRIAEILPKHLSAERMVRIALAAAHRNPKIAECSPLSIVNCVIQASELGLEPGGALRHAYLVPYAKECTFQPSYMGLLELARRSGAFQQIEARCIHARDKFTLAYTPMAEFTHLPFLGDDPGLMTHAYAYAILANGGRVFEIATHAEVEAARAQSRAKDSLAWTKFYDEMAKKVVLKKLLKRQPCSVELARAVELDNREYDLEARPAASGLRKSRSASLAAALGVADEEPVFTEGTAGRVATEPEEPLPEPWREPGDDDA